MDRCDEPIDVLGLSARTGNCLKRRGILTKEQLLGMDDRELLAVRGFGKHCLEEVRGKLGGPVETKAERPEPMTLAQALVLVAEEHEKARGMEYIRNPLAYALYKVWKIADQEAEDV